MQALDADKCYCDVRTTHARTCIYYHREGHVSIIVGRDYKDVIVFNPYAPSNSRIPLSSCYRKHEQTKKRMYEQRCREVEHASFTPLVISATGGLAKEATILKDRPQCSPPNGTLPTAAHCAGYDADSLFHCYALQSSQSGEQDPLERMHSKSLLQLIS